MKNGIIIVAIILVAIIFYELFSILVVRKYRRKKIFKLASEKSKLTGKSLLVLGDPTNDNTSYNGKQDYGCGAICVDLTGCPTCPDGVKEKIETYLPKLKDNSYVVFASIILEYVDNFDDVVKQLNRVSGGDIFIVPMEPYSIKTNFFPNLGYEKFKRKRIIYSAPPYSTVIKYKELK